MSKTLLDKSTYSKPKTVHTIKGVTHTFNQPITRARAVQSTGNVRVRLPKGMTRSKPINLRINTYRAKDVLSSPAPLKASLMDTQTEFVKTILEVRMRHPRV